MKLCDFIEGVRDDLVWRWLEAIYVSLPQERRTLTQDQLIDSLHLFLDEILSELRSNTGRLVDEGKSNIAREHGGQRLTLGQELPELVREYGLLLECILELVDEAQASNISLQDFIMLSRCLSSGTSEAADEFARKQLSERRRQDYEHFAFLAHELRNPLSSVRLAWEITRRALPQQYRSAEVITRSLNQLAELIDESLIEARLRTVQEGIELRREPIEVPSILGELKSELSADAESKDICISVDGDDTTVHVDRRLIRSVLSNLIRNAIKFSHQGATVAVRSHAAGDRLLIEVADECGGIPPDRAESLFTAFTQIGADRSGFGLGLAIVKQAVEAHGGTIRVTNIPGKGCIFTVDLPLEQGTR